MKSFVKEFVVNYGRSLDDPDRGFWVKNDRDSWLKLHEAKYAEDKAFVDGWLSAISDEPFPQYDENYLYKNFNILREVTICDSSFVDVSIIHMKEGELYCLSGTVVAHSQHGGGPKTVSAKLFVKDYFYHFGQPATKGEPKHPRGMWVQDVYGHWFKIESYRSSYAQTASISTKLLSTGLGQYNFNDSSDKDARTAPWRHVSNHKVWRRSNPDQLVSLLDIVTVKDKGECSCTFLPLSLSDATPPLKVRLFVAFYVVDNGGEDRDNPNRGLWFQAMSPTVEKLKAVDADYVFPAVGMCHPDYAVHDASAARAMTAVRKLFDAIFHLDCADYNSKLNSCNTSIENIYLALQPEERFSLRDVAEFKVLMVAHFRDSLKGESKGFFGSIERLSDKGDLRCYFCALFAWQLIEIYLLLMQELQERSFSRS